MCPIFTLFLHTTHRDTLPITLKHINSILLISIRIFVVHTERDRKHNIYTSFLSRNFFGQLLGLSTWFMLVVQNLTCHFNYTELGATNILVDMECRQAWLRTMHAISKPRPQREYVLGNPTLRR